MDKEHIRRELFELSHYIWGLYADFNDLSPDELSKRFSLGLKRFCHLRVMTTTSEDLNEVALKTLENASKEYKNIIRP